MLAQESSTTSSDTVKDDRLPKLEGEGVELLSTTSIDESRRLKP